MQGFLADAIIVAPTYLSITARIAGPSPKAVKKLLCARCRRSSLADKTRCGHMVSGLEAPEEIMNGRPQCNLAVNLIFG